MPYSAAGPPPQQPPPHASPQRAAASAALRQAAQLNDTREIDLLLRGGAPVDTPQDDGCTALWLAAEAGAASACELLLRHGANPDSVKPGGGVPALYVAAQNGSLDTVLCLLHHGANPGAAKSSGATPLFIAAQQGHAAVAEALLRAGSDPDAPTQAGITPLMIAAHQGHVDVCSVLLRAGADPGRVGGGRDAFQWAAAGGALPRLQHLLAGPRGAPAAAPASPPRSDRWAPVPSPARAAAAFDADPVREHMAGTPWARDAELSIGQLVQRMKKAAVTEADIAAALPAVAAADRGASGGPRSYASPSLGASRSPAASPAPPQPPQQTPAPAPELGDGTPTFVYEEARRRAAFRQEVRKDRAQSDGVHHWADLVRAEAPHVVAREWERLKFSAERALQHLQRTKGDVPDAWMYTPEGRRQQAARQRAAAPAQALVEAHDLIGQWASSLTAGRVRGGGSSAAGDCE